MFAPTDLKKDLEEAVSDYPKLSIVELENSYILTGEIDVIHPDENEVIDTFSVKLVFPPSFPYRFPQVFETAGRIEPVLDRHVYPKTKNLCLAVFPEEVMKCRPGITTKWFLDNVLIPRLAEEYIVINGGSYSHEFSHGFLGHVEYYKKLLNTDSIDLIIGFLEMVAKNNLANGYSRCKCGSGKKFKRCHQQTLINLNVLKQDFAVSEITKLKEFAQQSNAKV